MSQDPRYAPPAAPLADPAAPIAPAQVRLAVKLLWASLALAVPACVLASMRGAEDESLVATTFIYGLMFGFSAYLNLKVLQGRNWARITTFAFVLIGGFFLFVPMDDPAPPSVVEWLINAVCLVLECVAVWFLFSQPGAAWYKRKA